MARRNPGRELPIPPPLLDSVPMRPSPTTRKPPKPSVAPYRRTPPRGSTADTMERVPSRPRMDDGRGYGYGAPRNIQAPEDYLAEAYANAGWGPAPGGYDPLADLLALLGGGPNGGGGSGSRGGGGGGGGGAPSRADVQAAIDAMSQGAAGAQSRIGEIYSAADRELARMAGEYAASQEALRAGGARTLGAFGVEGGMLDPMAQSAGDYLTATRGTLSGLSADQQARLEAQKAAYALILGDLLK